MKRWYIVGTYSGFENSVKEDLERRIDSMGMKEYIFQTLIPEETVIETKADGSKKEISGIFREGEDLFNDAGLFPFLIKWC